MTLFETATRNLRRLKELGLLSSVGSAARTFYEAGPIMLAAAGTMEPNSQDLEDKSHDKPPISIQDVPLALRQSIRHHGLQARARTEDTQALIEKLCRWRPLSASELAALLGKAAPYISQTHIAPMVKDGRLRFLHSEPNHPDQRYLAD